MTTRLKNARIRPYGQHGYQPVFGFVEPDPALGLDGKRTMGLPLTDHFIYGGLRTLDRKKYYSFYRHYNNQGALGFAVFEAECDAKGRHTDFSFNKQSKSAYLGAIRAQQSEGIWAVRDTQDDNPCMEVRAWPKGAKWYERDLVDITAEAVGSVSQICIPDSVSPAVYNTRSVRAKGSFLGHEVEGWLQMDNAYMPDGSCWFNSIYYRELQGAWTDFVTEYDDGTVDHGMMICGREGFNAFCVESSDSEPVVIYDPVIDVELDETAHPLRFSVDIGNGDVWDWRRLAGDKAKIPSAIDENSGRWIQGVFSRRGEKRKIKSADGWVESFRHGLEHLL